MFDKKAYRESVLVPLAKDPARMDALKEVIRDIQSNPGDVTPLGRMDFGALYAITSGMDKAVLTKHLSSLKMLYNTKKLPSSELLKQLLDSLEKAGSEVSDTVFWGTAQAAQSTVLADRLDTYGAAVAADFPLRVITTDAAREVARSMGLATVSDAELQTALAKVNVDPFDDFEAPTTLVPAVVSEALKLPEFPTLADVLLLGTGRGGGDVVTAIDRFASGGSEFTPASVDTAHANSQKVRGEGNAVTAAQRTLTMLRSDFPSTQALRDLALATLLERAQTLLRGGAPRVAARDQLVKLGWTSVDAARAVTKLAGVGSGATGPTLADAAKKFAAGDLAGARGILMAMSPADEDAAERAQLERQLQTAEQKKADHISNFRAAAAKRNFTAAETALRAAIAIDRSDLSLEQELIRIPPAAPAALSVHMDGAAAKLAWTISGDDTLKFTIVRAEGRTPANPQDGTLLDGSATGATFKDPAPPVGKRVAYAVFSTRDCATYSDPVSSEILVVPPPSNVEAAASLDSIDLSWSVPREATAVTATRIDGSGQTQQYSAGAHERLHITGLTMGTIYQFSLTASYVVEGALAMSPSTVISAIPRGMARPVNDLDVTASGPAAHEATWTAPAGFSVELWSFGLRTASVEGKTLEPDELRAMGGQPLTLTALTGTTGQRAKVRLPTGLAVIYPTTVDGSAHLMGQPVVAGSAPQAENIVTESLGDDVRVSWVWPSGDFDFELTWVDGGMKRNRRISKARYTSEGGVRLAHASQLSDLTISTVVRIDGESYNSSAQPVPLAGSSTARISYALKIKKSLMGSSFTARISATADQASDPIPVLIVVRDGGRLPLEPEYNDTIMTETLTFNEGLGTVLSLDLGKLSSPFWVRMFPAEQGSALFEDPPATDMKG